MASSRLPVVGLALVVGVVVFSFLGPLVYHGDVLRPELLVTNRPPSGGHPLGTDDNGFDVLGRLMAGGRSALEIGFGVAALATALGAAWGAAAGFTGGALDAVMMRVVDVFIAVPAIFVLIFLADAFRPTVPVLVVALSLMSFAAPARLVRGETLSLRTREFVEAARLSGSRRLGIVWRHLLPNTLGTVIVNATFQVADAIVVVAALSFLGFGLPPPAVSWGGMLSQGSSYLLDGYWWEVYPVLGLLVLTVLAVNFVGEGLRERLDVKLRRAWA
jgi:peptide/nickel transport system permease protein